MPEIKKIEINSKNYPELLKKIKNPPQFLYTKGGFPKGNCFAIVGTRRCSPYGKVIALEIAGELASAGLVIVSGMARGIDTYVHRGCLEKGGKTIAVLGTGLDEESIYPKENLRLSQEILEKEGCLISEYPPGTPGFVQNFPQRNRIISGISLGVLIVEAKIKSGALITANWAKSQNRKLFAIPGPLYSQNSKGPNFLIKTGARLVESAEDILKEFDLSFPKPISEKTLIQTPQENLILGALQEEPLHIEKLIEKTGQSPQKILSILAILEIKGKIKNLGGNIYTILH